MLAPAPYVISAEARASRVLRGKEVQVRALCGRGRHDGAPTSSNTLRRMSLRASTLRRADRACGEPSRHCSAPLLGRLRLRTHALRRYLRRRSGAWLAFGSHYDESLVPALSVTAHSPPLLRHCRMSSCVAVIFCCLSRSQVVTMECQCRLSFVCYYPRASSVSLCKYYNTEALCANASSTRAKRALYYWVLRLT